VEGREEQEDERNKGGRENTPQRMKGSKGPALSCSRREKRSPRRPLIVRRGKDEREEKGGCKICLRG